MMRNIAFKVNEAIRKNFISAGNIFSVAGIMFFLIFISACSKYNSSGYSSPPPATNIPDYDQTNLVGSNAGFNAANVDANLSNAWGIASSPTGILWIASNHKGLTTVYDSTGATKLAPVAIPSNGDHFGGSPTGVVFNGTTDFMDTVNLQPAKFIFVNEDGSVSAWSKGDSTITFFKNPNAVYKGLAMANDGNDNFLYAANFKGRKIAVFDKNFRLVTNRPFNDPNLPAGFGPFNIQNINGQLYVTYAKLQAPDSVDDEKGAGNGYVDIFKPDGSFVKRFASQGTLNSPWGIAQAPSGFGVPFHSILIGNFGDGRVNVYDSVGNYQFQLQHNGAPISIDGLWAILFPNSVNANADPNKLLFTAGPNGENEGLLGYLKVK